MNFTDPGKISRLDSTFDELEMIINTRFAFMSKEGYPLTDGEKENLDDIVLTLTSKIL